MKHPVNIPARPRSTKPEDLWEYAVKVLWGKGVSTESVFAAKMHNQWSFLIFGSCEPNNGMLRSEYMSRIHSKYSPYFIGRTKYAFDTDKIERHFPDFFLDGKNASGRNSASSDSGRRHYDSDSARAAVDRELELAQDPRNRQKYDVINIERVKNANIYVFTLDLDDDDDLRFYEGVKIKLKIGDSFFDCEGLEYDIIESELSVSCEKLIPHLGSVRGKIFLDSSFNLVALRNRLLDFDEKNIPDIPIRKFVNGTTRDLKTFEISENPSQSLVQRLDESQKRALDAVLHHDITFIWGPPGTGKSYTLATIICSLFSMSEKTLVCCISNVAVDQLVNKVTDVLDDENIHPKSGNFYRSGRTTDKKILDTGYLFPNDSVTDSLRHKLNEINDKLSNGKDKISRETTLVLKKQRISLRDELKSHTEYLINSSKVVFSTIANFMLTERLYTKTYDNLIIDEASMLSMPYLIAVARNVAKRIVLVGDPQQLGPISISNDALMANSIFVRCKVLGTKHPALVQLLNQRRSHPEIVRLINRHFYGNKLIAKRTDKPDWVNRPPFPGKSVVAINSGIDGDEVKYVGSTRRNFGTKDKVMRILEKYFRRRDFSFSIGIITPYRGQVKMYYAALRERYDGRGFWENIKVGTVHTFQGSECDLIIFDLVESGGVPVGKLFQDKEGEELVNVAFSRAKHKLIIVGDTLRFRGGAGINNVNTEVVRILGQFPEESY